MEPFRIISHPVTPIALSRRVVFYFNGQRMEGRAGEPIAAALMAHGIRILRYDRTTEEPRGIYCGIGHCYECRMTVNGTRDVRSCLVPVRDGMQIYSQDGWGRRVLDESTPSK